MYSQQRGAQAPQMSQSPSSDEPEPRERRPNLQQHYKPVGIGAITAAALCKSPRPAGKHDATAPQQRR